MITPKWINRGKPHFFSTESIKIIEEKKNATYVGDFATRSSGGWSEHPVSIFYQPNPDTSQGHKHYFCMFYQLGSMYISDGTSAVTGEIEGIVTPTGEVIYSRGRHDFRSSDDGIASIDGGRDYTRILADDLKSIERVKITIVDGKILVNDVELPYEAPEIIGNPFTVQFKKLIPEWDKYQSLKVLHNKLFRLKDVTPKSKNAAVAMSNKAADEFDNLFKAADNENKDKFKKIADGLLEYVDKIYKITS